MKLTVDACRLIGMVSPLVTMAGYLKLATRQRVARSLYFPHATIYYYGLVSLPFFSALCFILCFLMQGDDKEFYKFRLGSQEVGYISITAVLHYKSYPRVDM